jgi:MAF protein
MTSPHFILASTSPYRRELLARLRLPFDVILPNVDEKPLPDEQAQDLVMRLATLKAHAVAETYPDAFIIGADQVACLHGQIIGKPGQREIAIQQLTQASGQCVSFLTGLCLCNQHQQYSETVCELFQVYFKTLSQADIVAYVDLEQPLNCAGSFKSEGFGIALFERCVGDDPTALIGLPLIRLVDLLTHAGINIFQHAH